MNAPSRENVQKLIEDNLEFTSRLANQFYYDNYTAELEKEDLEGTAVLGLCDAARRFDPEKGAHFRTYAYFRIRGAMYDLVRKSHAQKSSVAGSLEREKPVASESNNLKISVLPTTLTDNLHDFGDLAQIVIGINTNPIEEIESKTGEIYSLSQEDCEARLVLKNTVNYLKKLTEQLPENEKQILQMHYFDGYSFEEIRGFYGNVSRSWISRMHVRGIDMLKDIVVSEQKNGVDFCTT